MREEIDKYKSIRRDLGTLGTEPNSFHTRAYRRLAEHGYLGGQHSSSNGTSTRDIPPLPMRYDQICRAMDEGEVPDQAMGPGVLAEFEAARAQAVADGEVQTW